MTLHSSNVISTLATIIASMPDDWLTLTTHRLDMYDESQAKNQFIDGLVCRVEEGNVSPESLQKLPTAFDYVRLGHQLSSVYEWGIAMINDLEARRVISFASKTMSLFSVLRADKEQKKKTVMYHDCDVPKSWSHSTIQNIYGYSFETQKVNIGTDIVARKGTTSIYVTKRPFHNKMPFGQADITIHLHTFGSTVLIHDQNDSKTWISKIQHVRRRETIAVTPSNSLRMIQELIGGPSENVDVITDVDWNAIQTAVFVNTGSIQRPLLATSGLSIQYAIIMGLIDHARVHHQGKEIKLIIPPNCYGGTNDQARRISAMIADVEVLDLPVDDGHDMTDGLVTVLTQVARIDAVPIILVEIPTNPRVEVPDMSRLGKVLSDSYTTHSGARGVVPVFIVDQTFCPNMRLLSNESPLAPVQTLSYSSGSKFPSGGRCTAGYATSNEKGAFLLKDIRAHLLLCNNEATPGQIKILATSMPSMSKRIQRAFENTQQFVRHIRSKWPTIKISFIQEDFIAMGFTPSVFSLDLPERGNTPMEKERYKKDANLRLIDHMIHHLPHDAKHCVSYGQLSKTYWTVPATSTQGTTKEKDKDYVVRVALPPVVNMKQLLYRFDEFCLAEGLR